MSKKFFTAIIILLFAVVAVEGYWLFQTYQKSAKKYTGPMEKITLGVENSLLPSLVWVAENKGYFEENGVEVALKEYDSGRAAFMAMLNEGGIDMVTVAQTPIMFNSFSRSDFAVIAAMVFSYNDVHVLARSDRGIIKPFDLRGKNIGVTAGSTGQYFLGLFLNNANIQLSEVNVKDIKTSELVKSLQEGTVDAISTWQPHIYNAQKVLGDKSITFPTRKIFREDFYFVPNHNFLQTNPVAIIRFLQAIKQAEDFTNKNKDEAIAVVSARLGLEKDFVAEVWDDFHPGLFLDNTIIQTIESEARWAIQNKLTDKTAVPNYLDFIYPNALQQVAPEKMFLISK